MPRLPIVWYVGLAVLVDGRIQRYVRDPETDRLVKKGEPSYENPFRRVG